jgi:hypothetical protein
MMMVILLSNGKCRIEENKAYHGASFLAPKGLWLSQGDHERWSENDIERYGNHAKCCRYNNWSSLNIFVGISLFLIVLTSLFLS